MSIRVLTIKEDVLGVNDEIAKKNQELVDKHHILLVNITSSPGAGKTSLIMQTINRFKVKARMAVIEGDVASTIDADKVNKMGIPAVQINTAGGCHLDANMVKSALENLDLEHLDLIIIENVGNLICTAGFALGAHKDVMILSVPEGDDKPYKYPAMFMASSVVLVNKIDVLPYFDFNLSNFTKSVNGLNPSVKIFPISAKTGEGMEAWFKCLENELKHKENKHEGK
jgi:hydrogenase nickel incorporation protein HypB